MGSCNSSATKDGTEPEPCTLVDFELKDLPDEVLRLISRHLFDASILTLLHLGVASKTLHEKMADLQEAAAARRIRWVDELNKSHSISNEGRTLTLNYGVNPWACGVPLPQVGRYSLSMRVECGHGGNMMVGVGNMKIGWGLCLSSGKCGCVTYPKGLAAGEDTQVMLNAAGKPASLKGKAESAMIEIVVDCDAGSLAFGVNGDSPRRVPNFAFPPSTVLRPWARLYGYMGDRIWMRGYFQPV